MDERRSEGSSHVRRVRVPAERDTLEPMAREFERSPESACQEAVREAGEGPAAQVLALQQAAGNRAVSALVGESRARGRGPSAIQARLSVGAVGDRFEQEAEAMADRVVPDAATAGSAAAPHLAVSAPGVQRSFLDDLLGGGGGGGGLGDMLGGLGGVFGGGLGGEAGGVGAASRLFGSVGDMAGRSGVQAYNEVNTVRQLMEHGPFGVSGEGYKSFPSGGSSVFDWASDQVSDVAGRAVEMGGRGWDMFAGPAVRGAEVVADATGSAVDWARDRAGDVWEGVQGAGESAGDWARDRAGDVWSGVSGAGERVGEVAGNVWDIVSDAGSGIGDWTAGLFGEEDELGLSRADGAGAAGFDVAGPIEQRLAGGRGSGTALSAETRAVMEPAFAADFSDVRVHADAEAAQISRQLTADAFTHGQDIYMAEGRYDPDTDDGKHLLAHELTHVVQQTGGGRE